MPFRASSELKWAFVKEKLICRSMEAQGLKRNCPALPSGFLSSRVYKSVSITPLLAPKFLLDQRKDV